MVRLNLLPPDVQVEAARHRHLRRWTVSTFFVFLGFLISLSVEWTRQAQADDLEHQSHQLRVSLGTVTADLEAVSTEATRVLQQIERAEALRAKRSWSGMIGLIDTCLPSGSWLVTVATDPERAAAQPAAGPAVADPKAGEPVAVTIDSPRRLRIFGYATDASEPLQFVSAMKDQGIFSSVTLINSQMEPVFDGQYYRFEVICEWGS